MKTKNHSVFNLQYHIIFVIKYRNKAINQDIENDLKIIFDELLNKWGCVLMEFGAESDHVHLLIDAQPNINLSKLISNLKSVSARKIRKKYKIYLRKYFWKSYFWSRSYIVVSSGGASIKTIKKYIKSQSLTSDSSFG